jgi:hypothetical protein
MVKRDVSAFILTSFENKTGKTCLLHSPSIE